MQNMKKSILCIISLLLVTSLSAQEEINYENALKKVQKTNFKLDDKSVEINKEAIEVSAPMINLFLKYQGGDKKVNQGDFDQMLNQMGIMDDVQNDKSGLTKEDAFNFINAYINADQGNKINVDAETQGDVISFLTEIEKGKQNASKIFENMIADGNIDMMRANASIELHKEGIRYEDGHPTWFTYKEWEAIVLSSDISEDYKNSGFIRAQYNAIIEDFKSRNSNFREPK